MNEEWIPPRVHTGFEDEVTEELFEIVGQHVYQGVTGGPWSLAVINFAKWEGGAQVRGYVKSEGNVASLDVNGSLVRGVFGELCFRMGEAGHGWNVATYRLTRERSMNIEFGLREEPWDMRGKKNHFDFD